jgi:hypothetical protein
MEVPAAKSRLAPARGRYLAGWHRIEPRKQKNMHELRLKIDSDGINKTFHQCLRHL